jgi:hypothetical protein
MSVSTIHKGIRALLTITGWSSAAGSLVECSTSASARRCEQNRPNFRTVRPKKAGRLKLLVDGKSCHVITYALGEKAVDTVRKFS